MKDYIFQYKKRIIIFCIIMFAICAAIHGIIYFRNTHFLYGTEIEGVSCSFLTVEKAKEKIEIEKGKENITFCFSTGRSYDIQLNAIGLDANEEQIAQFFKKQHENPKEQRKYQLDGFILVDEKLLETILMKFPEFQKENMVEPQDAYIAWNEIEFTIQEETYGTIFNPEEAKQFAINEIKNDDQIINFALITDIYPEIYEEDLENEKNELNVFLNSVINFKLGNGEIVTLDSNTIKNWVYKDKNEKYAYDTENGIAQFIEYLDNVAYQANASSQFIPTGLEQAITINILGEFIPRIDREKEFAEILNMLGNTEPIYTEPIYEKGFLTSDLASYIEIDISRQHIWFYLNGELLVETDCVTGNVSQDYDTPTGMFYLLNKDRGVNLEGLNKDGSKYSSYVEYWMRFYQGFGMHDAKWRNRFGGNIYKTAGSHGCVNLPSKIAPIFYENIDDTMPIIVYQSEHV